MVICPAVTWMRGRGYRIAHAFAEIDLREDFERIEPVAPCGRWLRAALQPDDSAERCRACLAVTGGAP